MFTNNKNGKITKDNIDFYLKEFAKVFKKLNGSKMPAEIILVGGASILVNYNFRNSTGDIDAIIKSSSVVKEAIQIIKNKYNLSNDWLNADFEKSTSYSQKLREISKYYKTLSNILELRTVDAEYLVAMKLMAGRLYKHDLSDIVGIFWEQEKNNKPLTRENIEKAVTYLYGDINKLPKDSIVFFEKVISCNNIETMFYQTINDEKNAKNILENFSDNYPKAINKENISIILKELIEKEKKANNI